MKQNPFIDDSIVRGKDYCPRKGMEARLITKLSNGHNLALIGDRRIGKTSTAHHVIDEILKLNKVDIDLFHVMEASDIAEAIIDACRKVLNKVWDTKKVVDFAKRLSPTLEITNEKVSFGIETKGEEYKKTLNVAFEFLDEVISRTSGKVAVLFDEFQAIRSVKNGDAILKYMRGKIQKTSRVPFMYVGSIRHEMDHIFRNQASPFYKQAEIIYFEHIEIDSFYDFLSERFKQKNILLNRKAYDYLYEICQGITGDIQTFCRVAFDTLEDQTELNFKSLFFVLDIIFKNEQKYFKAVLDGKELTKVQKSLLIQLAGAEQREENMKLFSKGLQAAIGVKSPGAVTNALNALEKKEYIYKTDGRYFFSNPFFREWILDHRYIIHAQAGGFGAGMPLSGTRLDFGYRERLINQK